MYEFDKIVNRRDTDSLKWEVNEGELPMWVADMDFQTAPEIIKALEERVKSGIFGYSVVSEEWKQAIIGWWQSRHHLDIEKEWLLFSTGVVPAISCAVKRLTNVGDNVVVMTPAYDIFFNSIENHGRHVFENKLKYKAGEYSIDFTDLEIKLSHPQTTMMILCNPHNPVGKIWNKEELLEIAKLCKKHHVVVLSDEIHCDLTDPGFAYTPYAGIGEEAKLNSVTCISTSKAFNLAGLQASAVIIPSEKLRNKMERGLNSDEIAEPNAFAIEAMIAAFTKGESWLEELRRYLLNNKNIVSEFLKNEIPNLRLVESNATYLLWFDCQKVLGDARELCFDIRETTGLYLSSGNKYRGNGHQFIRMNIACPSKVLLDGLERLKEGVDGYEKKILEQC